MYFTLPLLAGDWRVDQVAEQTATGFYPDPVAMAWRVRLMQVLLGLVLGALLWRAARRYFSPGAANFTLALFAFSPALVAHFSLATTDAAGILMTFVAAMAVVAWRRSPSRRGALWLGLILGILLVAKYYTPPLFLLALAWVLTAPSEAGQSARIVWNPLRWNWMPAVLICLVAFVVVWGSFFFHVSRVELADGRVTLRVPGHEQPFVEKFPPRWNARLRLPLLEYMAGLGAAMDHNRRGHRSYFLGEVSPTGGWKLYFPAVILLKWPTVVLGLLLAAVLLLLMRRLPWPREFLVLMSFPIVFFFPAVTSRINIGDRHILPVYPFVLLAAGGVWEAARRSSRRRMLSALLVVALALLAADTLRYAPDYISWFNLLVDPHESWRLLADSSLDWGQGLLALRDYQATHPEEILYLAYYGNVAPEVYGIRYIPLQPGDRPAGTVAVSAVHLAGRLQEDPNAFRWLLEHPRIAVLNHTIHLFRVSPPAESGPVVPR
jgi:hypothetical protein